MSDPTPEPGWLCETLDHSRRYLRGMEDLGAALDRAAPEEPVFVMTGSEIAAALRSTEEVAYARGHAAGVAQERARCAALEADKARLDFLDEANRTLNAAYGTTYRWSVVMSHNVNRLMLGRNMSVDLHDSDARGLPSCRDAIDAKMRERAAAIRETPHG
jgi:hypothetical protein